MGRLNLKFGTTKRLSNFKDDERFTFQKEIRIRMVIFNVGDIMDSTLISHNSKGDT